MYACIYYQTVVHALLRSFTLNLCWCVLVCNIAHKLWYAHEMPGNCTYFAHLHIHTHTYRSSYTVWFWRDFCKDGGQPSGAGWYVLFSVSMSFLWWMWVRECVCVCVCVIYGSVRECRFAFVTWKCFLCVLVCVHSSFAYHADCARCVFCWVNVFVCARACGSSWYAYIDIKKCKHE